MKSLVNEDRKIINDDFLFKNIYSYLDNFIKKLIENKNNILYYSILSFIFIIFIILFCFVNLFYDKYVTNATDKTNTNYYNSDENNTDNFIKPYNYFS